MTENYKIKKVGFIGGYGNPLDEFVAECKETGFKGERRQTLEEAEDDARNHAEDFGPGRVIVYRISPVTGFDTCE